MNILRKEPEGISEPVRLRHFRSLQVQLCTCSDTERAPQPSEFGEYTGCSSASAACTCSQDSGSMEPQDVFVPSSTSARELLAKLSAQHPLLPGLLLQASTYVPPPEDGRPMRARRPVVSRRFPFPSDFTGLVIGFGGQNVRQVLADTGAQRVVFERHPRRGEIVLACCVYGPSEASVLAAHRQLVRLHRAFAEERRRFEEMKRQERREREKEAARQARYGGAPADMLPGYSWCSSSGGGAWVGELRKLSAAQVERRAAGAAAWCRHTATFEYWQRRAAARALKAGGMQHFGGTRRWRRQHHRHRDLARVTVAEVAEGLELARLCLC